jgi:hypothetical protein
MLALLMATAVVAVVTWFEVAKILRNPDRVPPAKVPHLSGLVWSHRVFVDRLTFKRWLAAHDESFAVWVRQHPNALDVLPVRARRAHR